MNTKACRHEFLTSLRILLFAGALVVFHTGCATLEPNPAKPVSHLRSPVSTGILANVSRNVTSGYAPGQSGFQLIKTAEDALKWRLALVDHATRTLDIQYYLWNGDEAGTLLFNRLIDAAERGVRVRLLVDDFLYSGDEDRLAALSYHPNINIRIFNPTRTRGGKLASLAEFLWRFRELNQRMHNKAFIADNRIAIMGGRNVGNAYFGLSKKYNFVDLDVASTGPIVKDISASFDEYWNSDPAYPGEAMSAKVGPEDTAEVIAAVRRSLIENPGVLIGSPYPMKRKNWSRELAAYSSRWHPGFARMLSDEATVDPEHRGHRFLDESPKLVRSKNSTDLTFVTPYLIPMDEFYTGLDSHRSAGVPVTFIVPSLGANNQWLVHSHYRKHRRELLAHGVRIFEMREDGTDLFRKYADVSPVRSAVVALHVKSGVGDRRRSFIGSLNLDPRSIEINTENGLYIESVSLSRELMQFFDDIKSPQNAWEVTLDEKGKLSWESRGEKVTKQPAPNGKSRLKDFIGGLLPIANQL